MKNRTILFAVALMSAAVAAVVCNVVGVTRTTEVAYVETGVLLGEFSAAVKARTEFEAAQKEWDKNLKALNDSLLGAMHTMRDRYDRAPEGEKKALRETLQRRDEDLQRYTEAVKHLAMEKEQVLMEPVLAKLNAFLKIWGEENGYDMILGTLAGGNILHANANLNVTHQVIRDLNAHYRDLPLADSATVKKKVEAKKAPAKKSS